MSEPKITGEVEDVLSSIRRLVAGEGKPAGSAAPDTGVGKLILTPALRVVPAEPAAAEPAGAADAAETPASAPEGMADATVILPVAEAAAPDLVASIGAATDLGGTVWESETGDPWSADSDSGEVAAAVLAAVSEPAGASTADSGPAALFPDAGHADDAADDPLAAEEAATTAAPAEIPASAEPEADPADTADTAGDAGAAEPVAMEADTVGGGDAPDPAEPVADDPFAVPAAAAGQPPQDAGANPFAPIPTAASAQADPPAADHLPETGPVRSAPEPVAEAVAAPFAHRAPAPMPPPVAAPFLAIEDEDGPLDEEALRDLVRDLIREELQGPLGERITRNLRKLVRAEVQRALATKALD